MSRFTRLTPTLFCELDALSRTFAGRPIIVEWAAFRCRACRLWEISENLHRAELSDVERSKLIEEWRELTCEKVFQVGTPSGGRQQKDIGVRKTSQELGVTPQEVHRAHKIATMAPEAHEVARELGLDSNQSALLEAAKQTTAEAQVESLRRRTVRLHRREVSAAGRGGEGQGEAGRANRPRSEHCGKFSTKFKWQGPRSRRR